MDDDLREMLDHRRITRTLAEYCHGCDRCDELLMASVYHEDSFDDHGHLKARGREFTWAMIADIRDTTTSLSHLLGQSLIRIDGDEAGAETYFFAAFLTEDPDGTRLCNQLGGRYLDRLVREDGRWLVKDRLVVRDWSVSVPVIEDRVLLSGLRDGQRSNDDPPYALLGLSHSGERPAAFAAAGAA